MALSKCRYCKERFEKKPLQKMNVCYKFDCISKFYNAKRLFIKKKINNIGEMKKTPNYKNILQREIQHIARLIDYGHKCIVYGNDGMLNAGHIYARGGNSNISFNLHNIHRQSVYSNKHRNDSYNLIMAVSREYGESYLNFITESKRTKIIKYTNEEYKEFSFLAKKIIKELKSELKIYDTLDRIKLRNEINLRIGVVKEYMIYE